MLLFAGLQACARGPIVWEDPAYLPHDAAVAIGLHDSPQPCGNAESALGSARFRAGWGTNGEGLLVVRSGDSGSSWSAPVIVESRASSSSACSQLAVFADTMNRYLHLTYFLDTQGAAGLYYAHSMNADKLSTIGEGMFETPRAIVYGDRPVPMSIASRSDTVAVVHEDPNSPRARIELALSTTGGHSFDYRGRVSPDVGEASRPTVRLRAGTIEVVWLQVAGDTARAVRRIGRFR